MIVNSKVAVLYRDAGISKGIGEKFTEVGQVPIALTAQLAGRRESTKAERGTGGAAFSCSHSIQVFATGESLAASKRRARVHATATTPVTDVACEGAASSGAGVLGEKIGHGNRREYRELDL